MKTIVLTEEQLDNILLKLEEDISGDGDFTSFYEDDDFSIDIDGYCEIVGYVEDDNHCGYMNGTGAYVERYRDGSFNYTAYLYDNEIGDSEEVQIDENSYNKIYDYLNKTQQ